MIKFCIGGNYTIFSKEFGEFHNYISIVFYTPYIWKGSYNDELISDAHGVVVEANTKLQYRANDFYWFFMIKLLGFGFSIKRQWGY